jgi:large subunit ribosomal protein L31
VTAHARKGIHPELKTAKIICSGEEVGEITGTQDKYVVDVWAGNHPFYKGDTRSLVLDEGQVRMVAGPCSDMYLFVSVIVALSAAWCPIGGCAAVGNPCLNVEVARANS